MQLGDVADEGQAERVAAWADRLRAKRAADKAWIEGEQAAARGEGPSYWTTDALFQESKRVEQQEAPPPRRRPDPAVVAELLAVLDLREGADPDQLTAAYRRLAKVHHPDRYVEADEATRRFHEERMLEVNRAYRHLRSLHDA